MKYVVYLITLLFSTATAQNPTILQGNYISNVFGQSNFVKNPNAQTNVTGVTLTTATATRSTTTPLVATTEWNVTITSANGTVAWDTRTFDAGMKNQNCEARFTYRGFQATSKAQIKQGSNVVAELVLTPSATDPRIASINFPCGDLSSATTFVITDTATLAGVHEIGGIYVGLATNQANVAQAEAIVRVGKTGTQTITPGTEQTLVYDTETLDVYNEYNPTNGVFTAKRAGTLLVNAAVLFDGASWTAGNVHQIAVFNGSNVVCKQRVEAEATRFNYMNNEINCQVSVNVGDTVTIPVFQNTSSNILINTSAQWTHLEIYRFPSSSELVVTPETQNVWGSVNYTGTAGSLTVRSGQAASNTFDTFSGAGFTSARTLKGKCKAPVSGDNVGCQIENMPVGNYEVSVSGLMFQDPGTTTVACSHRIFETTTSTQVASHTSSRLAAPGGLLYQGRTIKGVFNNTAVANRNFVIQAAKGFVADGSTQGQCLLFINTSLDISDVNVTVTPLDNASNSALYVQGPVKAAGTGTAIPAGYQFEELTGTSVSNFSMISGNSYKLAQITLQPGLYLLEGRAYLSNNAIISAFRLDISTNNGSVLSTFESGSDGANGANNARSLIRFFRVTSAQTYYLNGYVIWSGTFVNFIGSDSFLKAYRLN